MMLMPVRAETIHASATWSRFPGCGTERNICPWRRAAERNICAWRRGSWGSEVIIMREYSHVSRVQVLLLHKHLRPEFVSRKGYNIANYQCKSVIVKVHTYLCIGSVERDIATS